MRGVPKSSGWIPLYFLSLPTRTLPNGPTEKPSKRLEYFWHHDMNQLSSLVITTWNKTCMVHQKLHNTRCMLSS